MSQWEDYEEDFYVEYWEKYEEAKSMEVQELCKAVLLKDVDPKYRELVRSIKTKVKEGRSLSPKQLNVLYNAYAYAPQEY